VQCAGCCGAAHSQVQVELGLRTCQLVYAIVYGATTESSYAAVLGHWYRERVCRKRDGAPERGHLSPKACMVEEAEGRRPRSYVLLSDGSWVSGAERVTGPLR
jgi:hypothetical protein